jgi:hypothetical protein
VASTLNADQRGRPGALLPGGESLGYAPRTALLLTLGFGFTTSFLPYTKSYLRERCSPCAAGCFWELRRHLGQAHADGDGRRQ